MGSDANPLDDPADAAALQRYATVLVEAVDASLPGWVTRAVRQRWVAWAGEEPGEDLAMAAAAAADAVRAEVVPALRALLATDVDAQRSNPLALIRQAVVYPTRVLTAARVPPVQRDADAERLFPDDPYDLSPASFGDLDPAVHEPGIEWGAAKAHIILRRHRSGG